MKNKFAVACAIFCALFLISLSARAAIPPAEELLPRDTLFVFTVPDFAALKSAAHQSPQWLFWNDPAMKPFHDNFMGKLKENFIAPLERDLGVKFADFADLPRGQLTFAITQNGWDGGDEHSPGFLLLLDAKNKSDLLKTNLAALEKKWLDDGKPIRTEIIRGLPFSVVTLASNDIPPALAKIFPHRPPVQELGVTPKPEKPGELVVGQFDSLLIAGNSVEAVAPVVAHLTGSGMPSLADNAAFAADKLSQFHDAPLYFGWFNAKTFFSVLASVPPAEPNPDAPTVFPRPQWGKIFDALGLTGVTSASAAYHQSRDGALLNFFIAAPESSRDGIFKMLATEPKSAAPPNFVPADATKFWRWRVDGQQGWSALQKMLGEIVPGGLLGLNAAIDMANATAQQNNPGFDVRQYLFENLGDDFIRYQKNPAGNLSDSSSLFLFAVHDPDRAVASVQTVLTMAGQTEQKTPSPRDFAGHKIFTIPLPGRHVIGAPAAPLQFIYCASADGYVAVTTDVSMMEEYLRSAGHPPKPLSRTPGLLDAAQHVGGAGKGLFGYQNQRELMRQFFTTLKNPPSAGATGVSIFASGLSKGTGGWMDFSLLPDYDAVSKYFYFSVFSGNTTTRGMEFNFFAPRPPGLE